MKTRLLSGGGMQLPHFLAMVLTLLVLLLPSQAKADDEAWAEYNSTETTLTFMYGEKPTSLDEGVTAYALNEGTAIPQWNTDNTCSSVTKVVFDSSFANARPTSCHYWFCQMKNLASIEGLANLNTEAVADMSYMFFSCTSLTTLDLSSFNTASVTDMSMMFSYCSGLETVNMSGFNTASVTDMNSMFYDCTSLTTLDLSSFNTANVTDMSDMFYNCKVLTTINVTKKFNTGKVDNGMMMFYNCAALKGAADYDSSKTNLSMANADDGYFTMTLEAWAEFDSKTSTLTFKYGAKPASFDENITAYVLNEGENYPGWANKSQYITTVVFDPSFADARPTTCCCWFKYQSNLTDVQGIANLNTGNVTDMSYMFQECSSLTTLDLSGLNAENVTDMKYMFADCCSLKSINFTGFKTSKVKLMLSMFEYDMALETLDLSSFSTENLTDLDAMFRGCTSLKSVDLSSFNTANVTTAGDMFDECNSLIDLDVTNFNTANIENMSLMFSGCSSLTTLDLSGFNTEKVTDMMSMFNGNSALTSLDLSSFNTANVKDMDYMFEDCSALTTIYVGDKFSTDVATGKYMFLRCNSLQGATAYSADKVDIAMANTTDGYFTEPLVAYAVYASNKLTFKYGKVDTTNTYFIIDQNNVTDKPKWYNYFDPPIDGAVINHLTKVVFDPSFINAHPKSCANWFYEMTTIKSIEGLEYLNTDRVKSMYGMFYKCTALESLDLSKFDTRKVTDMKFMFYKCTALTSLDLSNFDTRDVTNMYGMFGHCTALTSVDVTGFNTKNVTDMTYMFAECPNLTTIYASDKFSTEKVTASDNMFFQCDSLKAHGAYDELYLTADRANFTKKWGYFKSYYRVGDTKHEVFGIAPLSVEEMTLEDGKDFVAHTTFTAGTASYSRKMANNWGTLCLPFAVDAASVTGCSFYGMESVSNDVITLKQIDGTIAAGTPVLVYSTNGSLSVSASNAAVVKEPVAGSEASGYQLVGSFTETEVPDDGYIISKNKFWLTSDLKDKASATAVKTKGLRAWLKYSPKDEDEDGYDEAKAHVLGFAFDDEDETSAIETVDALTEGKAEIYDIQGHRTDRLQKGLNIVKMGGVTKKVMVK